MFQKILISLLVPALLGVSAAWGYSEWSRQPPHARAVHAAAAVPAAAPPPAAPPPAAPAPADDAKVDDAKAEGPRFVVEYVPPQDPALADPYEFAKKLDLYSRLPEIRGLDGMFDMPRPLRLVTAECQQVNAFYNPDKRELVLCYEMIETILQHADDIAREKGYDGDFTAEYLLSNLRFIMLHEMGHALIDILDLSTTGREEDAADQLATTLMLTSNASEESPEDIARHLQMAASFFMAGSDPDGGYDLGTFADEHSLGEQRYFNVLCLLYGRDPGRYLPVVTHSGLPEARAMRCPDESKRVTTSWARLLSPHFAPRYRDMTPEQAAAVLARSEAERRERAGSPYVRGADASTDAATGDAAHDDTQGNPYARPAGAAP